MTNFGELTNFSELTNFGKFMNFGESTNFGELTNFAELYISLQHANRTIWRIANGGIDPTTAGASEGKNYQVP